MRLWEQPAPADDGQSTRWILWSRDGQSHLHRKAWRDDAADAVRTRGRGESAPPSGDTGPAPHRAAGRRPVAPVQPDHLIHRVIDERRVDVAFQPVIDVARGHVVGFEALARGPEGPLRRPTDLFAAARAVGRAGELDWAVRAHAFRTLMDADIHPSVSLFVNIAPDSLIEPCPEDLLPTVWEAETRLRVFVDIDGGSALRHPREVLESVRRARAAGWGVSLDDVGYSAASTAFLPLLEPDVIRLDHQLLSAGIALGEATLTSALGEAERNGASIVVGNIEDAGGRDDARSIGAAFQQGWFHGREGNLPASLPDPVAAIPMLALPAAIGETPWAMLTAAGARTMTDLPRGAARNTARQLLGELSRLPQMPVLGLLLPHGFAMSPDVRAMKRVLLENAPLALIMGADVAYDEHWRTRTAEIPPDHLLADQGCIVALSGATMMVAAFRRTPGPGSERWDLAISHSRRISRAVMRELLHHADRLSGGVVAALEGTAR